MNHEKRVTFTYKNHKGEVAKRTVRPYGAFFGGNK